MKNLMALATLVLSLFSCATFVLEPIPSDSIAIKKDRGNSLPFFVNDRIGLIASPEFHGSEILIKINLSNISEESISFTDSDFEIDVSTDGVIWKPLRVYSSKEYYSKEKSEYIAGAVIMVLGAVADTASAGQGSATTTGNVYGSSQYGSYSGTYTSTTRYYDSAAAELAAQRNSQMISSYASTGKAWLELLENNLFYSIDMAPGEGYFGMIFSKKGNGKYYRIRCNNESADQLSIEYIKEKY